jgi:hypothetical protein
MPARFAYSLNGENYVGTFATREDALRAGIDAAHDPVQVIEAQTVFVARRVEADPHAAGHARTILREMAWQAHDEVGAPAVNYLRQLSDAQISELDGDIEKVLIDWLKRHDLMPTYYRVEGISEHPVPIPRMNGKAAAESNHEVHEIGTVPDGQ